MNDIIKNSYRIWHIENFRVEPDGAKYEAICTLSFPPFNEDGDLLETIFHDHQNDFHGARNPPRTRSLSVGDVIQLFDDQGISRYRRVAGVGFEKVRRVNDSFEKVGA